MTVRNPNDPLEVQRHSFAHITAAAVLRLFPKARLGVGPVIDDGYYHDVEIPDSTLTEKDLPRIEEEMKKIIAEKQKFVKEMRSTSEAIKFLGQRGQIYTQELAKDLLDQGVTEVSFYSNGDFVNMCTGPHVDSTTELDPQAFRLTKLAGVFWKSTSTRPQIQRIYGVSFTNKQQLDLYFVRLEEAKKRDHRKLGKELHLFTFSPLVGSGLPLFTPRGALIRKLIEDFLQELQIPLGYERVWIPHLAKPDLYKTSGHWDKFKDDLFHVKGGHDNAFVLKPMNCPHHTQIYASKQRSFRELPLRFSEVTTIYRDEQPGELQGLSRVLSITQDDAHVFCTLEQVLSEAKGIFDIVQKFYRVFELPLSLRLSVRDPHTPEKYLGGDDVWNQAEDMLAQVIADAGEKYEKGVGEAAFYGPKIDFMALDSLGRKWQVATIQLDFNQPKRFDLTYQDKDGTSKHPIMIHRAIAGSLERFLSLLIEHLAGNFPVWLSPVQIALLPVQSQHIHFAEELKHIFDHHNLRVQVYADSETIGKKIAQATQLKIPYVLVLGEKEISGTELAVRKRGQKNTISMTRQAFIDHVVAANKERLLAL